MRTCENCHLTFDDTKKFCFNCGAPLMSAHQMTSKKITIEPKETTIEPKMTSDELNDREEIIESPKVTIQPEIETNHLVSGELPKEPTSQPITTFNKALSFFDRNQIEKALELFRSLYDEGQHDRITTIYLGICEAIQGDYKTAIAILRPILNNNNRDTNDVMLHRGYLYLAYSLCQNSVGISEIKKWTEKINYDVLDVNPFHQDEHTNVKIIEYIVNRSLRNINQPREAKEQIEELIKTYLTDTCFTENCDSSIAEIWYAIGNKYAKFNLSADALKSFQLASSLNPDERKYNRKVFDIENAFVVTAKKRKRKIFKIIVYTILLVLVVGSLYVYGDTIKSRVMKMASKKTEVEIPQENVVKDIDGNVYHTVNIGTQVWMVENLRTTRYSNGDPILYVSDNKEWGHLNTGGYSFYNNVVNNRFSYGALYNWFAVDDARKIAPEGWHVPSDAEWEVLINYLGGSEVAGGKLKETGTSHWQSPNTNASNKSGFGALPGGSFRPNEAFIAMGYVGTYWSSTEYKEMNYDQAKTLEMSFTTENANQLFQDQRVGMSVRCIQDY